MKYLLFLFPIFLQAQCLIPTHSYRLICADEVRYADSISSGSRLYISSRNAFVTSPRSVFSLVNGYGQHFIQITNSANSQKVVINRAWINRIDSTSSNKALIYIKDISVTFTTTESYTAVKDSAIACFIRSVASGLATLSDGDYGDVVVSGGGLVMTVDKPDLGLHNLADGDFSVTADSTALSLTNTRAITLQTKNIDGWISRYLQTNNSLTLRANSSGKNSRIFVDTTGANFQFVNGSNNASLRVGDSVAVRFNTSGSVGQVLTVTSIDGDGRLVINPKTGGSGTANCEQTITKTAHGFQKWTPIYWNGSAWARPTFDSIIPTYIVVDSTSANTFKVANCGNYSSTLTAGLYYYKGASPGYSLTPTSIPTPLFEVAQARLILQPLVGFNLAGGSGGVSLMVLADTAAAIRADFPSGVTDGDKGEITITGGVWTIDNGVISNAKLATNAVDSTKAANLSPNDLAQTGANTNDILTWTGTKYAPRASNGATNLTYTASPTQGTVNSDTGTDAVISVVDATNAGLITPAQSALIAQIPTQDSLINSIDVSAFALEELGSIITDSFNRASLGSNWTNTGSGTFSVSSNSLSVSAASFSTSNYISWNAYGNSNLESFTVDAKIIAGTVNSTSYGVGFTFQSNGSYLPVPGGKNSCQIGIDLTTTNQGKISIYNNNSTTPTATSPSGITISTGDTISVRIKFIKHKFIVTAENITTNKLSVLEYDIFTSSPYGLITPNAFRFGIAALGGTHTVDDFSVTANDVKKVNYLLIGDSQTKGFSVDNIVHRWGELINNSSNTITQTNAGGGNCVEDINVNEILALDPLNIVVLIGINNFQRGDNVATLQGKYTSFVSSLTGYTPGVNLFFGFLLPYSAYTASISSFNSWLLSTYGEAAIIDFNSPLNNANALRYSLDGIHTTNKGHEVMADIVINKFNIPSKPKKIGNFYPVMYNGNELVTIGSSTLKTVTPRYQLEILNSSNNTMLHLNSSESDQGAYLGTFGGGNLFFLGGATYNGTYTAKYASPGGYLMFDGNHYWQGDAGKTIGSTYTPTLRMFLSQAGKLGVGEATPTAYVHPAASTITTASIRVPSGTAPSSPNEGDLWNNGTDLFYRTGSISHVVAKVLKGSATLDFPPTAAGVSSDLTITVAGAADGDVVSLGVPNASVPATGTYFAWVSGTNTVTVRFSPTILVGSEDPASGIFKVTVTK